jgi:hypothetical protein
LSQIKENKKRRRIPAIHSIFGLPHHNHFEAAPKDCIAGKGSYDIEESVTHAAGMAYSVLRVIAALDSIYLYIIKREEKKGKGKRIGTRTRTEGQGI